MKKLKYIFLLAGALSLASCESWLDEDPQYTINTKTQFSTVENARQALMGCYGYMSADNAYGQAWQEVTFGYCGFGWSQTNGSSTDLLVSMDGGIDETINTMAWRGMYKVIGETNAFIANIADSPLESADKLPMEAAARFLRALAYYNLAVTYGDVPLKTTPSAHDGVAVPRSPKNEVFELVRTDWEFAYENLPEKDDDGFATKWAAKAYLGKLYHTLGCQGDNTAWEKAKACFDEVMPKYRLADKFSDLFVDYVQGSPESIFQLNFALAGSTTRNRGSWLVAPNGSCNGQAWDRIRASKALYDYFLATYPGDPRIESTFLTYWKSYAGVGKGEKPKEEPIASARDTVYAYPYFTYTIEGEEKPAGWKKPKLYVGRIPYEKLADPASPKAEELYAMIADTATATPAEKGYLKGLLSLLENATKKPSTNTKSWPYFKKPWDPEQSGNNSHKNLILYRYADMLLMAADVYNELGQTDKAITLANEVLKRARQSGNASQPADWKSGLSKEQVREKIYFERIFEGAGEPEMYQKMRLRGTELLKKAFEVNNGHGIIQESVANNPKGNGNWGERIFNDGNLNDENFLKKNLLLPVPKDEIDTNSALILCLFKFMNMNNLQSGLLFSLTGITAVASLSSCASQKKTEEQKPYNIVYIMTDDHTAQMMSCYDKRYMETPNLDRIANDGVRFTNSFVANSLSGPSRACMITGKHSCANKFYDNTTCIFDGSQQTFPKLLQQAGYQTALIGKWHLESLPTGFNYWEIVPGQGDYYNPDFITQDNDTIQKHGYITNIITDDAIDWMENKRDKDKPFCILIHHKAIHRNWLADTCNLSLYEDKTFPLPDNFFDDYEGRPAAAAQEMSIVKDMDMIYDLKMLRPDKQTRLKALYENYIGRMDEGQRAAWDNFYGPIIDDFYKKNPQGKELADWKFQRYMRDYMKTVKSLDDNVGRVLDYLKEKNMLDNTLVVYTSDQGFYMGEHGWFDKRFMYEESMHTPLIMRLPKGFDRKGDITELVQNIDYAPTFLELAGAPVPEDIQGVSLLPLLKGEKPADWRKSLYYHFYEYPAEHMVKRHYGVRTERYKLIHFYNDIDVWELYDLQADPTEMHNLYGQKEYEPVVTELKTELARLQEQYNDPVRFSPDRDKE